VKSKVIPVILGATGNISKTLRQYMNNVPGKHEVKELQKTAVLSTALHCTTLHCTALHTLREVLM
jgi:hypothetical protein